MIAREFPAAFHPVICTYSERRAIVGTKYLLRLPIFSLAGSLT